MIKKIIELTLITLFFFYLNSLMSKRFICTQTNIQGNKPTINFHIVNEKIYMGGIAGNGFFMILENNNYGLLAINAAKLGKEFGIQTLLIDKKEKSFFLRSELSSNKKSKQVLTKGKCDIFL